MLTNAEIQEIVEAVEDGAYGIDEVLNDIAVAAKGEDVRKALYAEAFALNKEGHAGSSDLGARAQIAVLKTSVDGLKEDKAERSEVGAVDSRIDAIINQIQVGTNEVKLFEGSAKGIGAVITLSDNLSNYDYLDVYVDKHGVTDILTIPATFTGGISFRFMNIADTQPDTGLDIDELSLQQTSETTLLINNESNWHWSGAANAAAVHTLVSVESTDSAIAHIIKIVGKKINSDFRNAELIDIRNGFDSETYGTAGAAVRGQVSTLDGKIGDLSNLNTGDKSNLVSAINEAAASGGSSGITEAVAVALLKIAEKVAYVDEDGAKYYSDLHDALYPPTSLLSISAVYTQSGTVYDSASLDDLTDDLVVTATYDDSTTSTIPSTDYVLSGTLAEGTSTITVSYSGKTTTFNVTVTAVPRLTVPWVGGGKSGDHIVTNNNGVYTLGIVEKATPAADYYQAWSANCTQGQTLHLDFDNDNMVQCGVMIYVVTSENVILKENAVQANIHSGNVDGTFNWLSTGFGKNAIQLGGDSCLTIPATGKLVLIVRGAAYKPDSSTTASAANTLNALTNDVFDFYLE